MYDELTFNIHYKNSIVYKLTTRSDFPRPITF